MDLAEECIEISAFARRIQTCLTAYECGTPFVFFLKAIFANLLIFTNDSTYSQSCKSELPQRTPSHQLARSCAKKKIAYIIAIACAKIGIIPLAGIVFCYLNSCHFYFTEIETFIDT